MPNADELREALHAGLIRSKDEEPRVSLVFKDVT